MAERNSPLARRLIEDGLRPRPTPEPPLYGRIGLLLGALRDIANDMPGTPAPAKRAKMRERALSAIRADEAACQRGRT